MNINIFLRCVVKWHGKVSITVVCFLNAPANSLLPVSFSILHALVCSKHLLSDTRVKITNIFWTLQLWEVVVENQTHNIPTVQCDLFLTSSINYSIYGYSQLPSNSVNFKELNCVCVFSFQCSTWTQNNVEFSPSTQETWLDQIVQPYNYFKKKKKYIANRREHFYVLYKHCTYHWTILYIRFLMFLVLRTFNFWYCCCLSWHVMWAMS